MAVHVIAISKGSGSGVWSHCCADGDGVTFPQLSAWLHPHDQPCREVQQRQDNKQSWPLCGKFVLCKSKKKKKKVTPKKKRNEVKWPALLNWSPCSCGTLSPHSTASHYLFIITKQQTGAISFLFPVTPTTSFFFSFYFLSFFLFSLLKKAPQHEYSP